MIDSEEIRGVEEIVWYHTLDLPGEVTTRGFVDNRGCADLLPFPDLTGKRCLDVGTGNGFWAFHLERLGAAHVTTIDIDDVNQIDWPPRARISGFDAFLAKDDRTHAISGFELAKHALGSQVERRALSVYELSPETLGTFDFVFVGSILLHLRDPITALARIRSVCTGEAIIFEAIEPVGSWISPRSPRALLDAEKATYWIPNKVALRRMIEAAGFDVVQNTRWIFQPVGDGFRHFSLRERLRGGLNLFIVLSRGAPHVGWRVRPMSGADRPATPAQPVS